jgi:hypothetical protein
MLVSSAFALSGRANLNYGYGESFQEGEKVSTIERLSQNYSLSHSKPITPILSYSLNLRLNLLDQTTEAEGLTRNRYRRTGEPGVDVTLVNPYFTLTSGIRRREDWSSARLKDETRVTSDFFYSRLDIVTRDFPSLYFEFDRSHTYDHLSVSETDSTSTRYSGSSSYFYGYKGLGTLVNFNYTRVVNDTPLSTIRETVTDIYRGSYDLSYNKSFWRNSVNIRANYRGSAGREDTTFKVTETGDVLFERPALDGLHAVGTMSEPDADVLSSEPTLVDDNTDAGIPQINIGTEQFHNIGVNLRSNDSAVDRIFIYVDQDVTGDVNLTDSANWRAFKSDINEPDTWEEINIQPGSVPVTEFDPINNIFRYEIMFDAPQNAFFFRVVNLETVDALFVTDVLVTEIEAHGVDLIPETGEVKQVEESFAQGIDLNVGYKPWTRLSLLLNYSITRTDANPESYLDSIGGIYKNIFSKEIGQAGDLQSSVRRSYGSSVSWKTFEALTTTFRVSRSEFFDNLGLTDFASNTYSLSLNSRPLPTLDALFSVIRSDTFNFDEKETTRTTFLFSLGTRLYRDLNMVTDTGYSISRDHESGIDTKNNFVRGTIDARITRELFTRMTYGFNWTTSDTESADSRDGSVVVTYRPAKLVSFSGSFRINDSDDGTTTTEGLSASWLPVPVLRLSTSYQHRNIEPGPDTTDSVVASARWEVSRAINVRVSYSYSKSKREIETENRFVNVSLNGRF